MESIKSTSNLNENQYILSDKKNNKKQSTKINDDYKIILPSNSPTDFYKISSTDSYIGSHIIQDQNQVAPLVTPLVDIPIETKNEINKEANENIIVNTVQVQSPAQIQQDFIKSVNEMTLENVFININLISKIETYNKLYIYNNFINIDTSYVQSVTRWFYGNDRKSTLFFLNLVINKSFEYCDNLLSVENNDTKLVSRLTTDIKNSINGLLNLKQTYYYDKLVQAEIDVIIENIKQKIESNIIKINKINIK